jgi:hypothetical protein
MATTTTRPTLTAARIAACGNHPQLASLAREHGLPINGSERKLRQRLLEHAAKPAAVPAVKAPNPQPQQTTPRPAPQSGKVCDPVRTGGGEVACYALEHTPGGMTLSQPVSAMTALRYAFATVATPDGLEALLDTAAELAEVARARIQAAPPAVPATPAAPKVSPQSIPPQADRVFKAASKPAAPKAPPAKPATAAPVAAKAAPAPKAAAKPGTGGLDAYRRLRARAKELGLTLPRSISGADLAARVAAAESAAKVKPAPAAKPGKPATVTLEVPADKAEYVRKLAALPVADLAELAKAFAGGPAAGTAAG